MEVEESLCTAQTSLSKCCGASTAVCEREAETERGESQRQRQGNGETEKERETERESGRERKVSEGAWWLGAKQLRYGHYLKGLLSNGRA